MWTVSAIGASRPGFIQTLQSKMQWLVVVVVASLQLQPTSGETCYSLDAGYAECWNGCCGDLKAEHCCSSTLFISLLAVGGGLAVSVAFTVIYCWVCKKNQRCKRCGRRRGRGSGGEGRGHDRRHRHHTRGIVIVHPVQPPDYDAIADTRAPSVQPGFSRRTYPLSPPPPYVGTIPPPPSTVPPPPSSSRAPKSSQPAQGPASHTEGQSIDRSAVQGRSTEVHGPSVPPSPSRDRVHPPPRRRGITQVAVQAHQNTVNAPVPTLSDSDSGSDTEDEEVAVASVGRNRQTAAVNINEMPRSSLQRSQHASRAEQMSHQGFTNSGRTTGQASSASAPRAVQLALRGRSRRQSPISEESTYSDDSQSLNTVPSSPEAQLASGEPAHTTRTGGPSHTSQPSRETGTVPNRHNTTAVASVPNRPTVLSQSAQLQFDPDSSSMISSVASTGGSTVQAQRVSNNTHEAITPPRRFSQDIDLI